MMGMINLVLLMLYEMKYMTSRCLLILQLVRSNTRKFMPSQADEEAHQLSYLQKHLANILTLLAEPIEGEGDEALVSCKYRII